MKQHQFMATAHRLAEAFKVTKGKGFRLKDYDPGDTLWLKREDKDSARESLRQGSELLAELQSKLYAQDRWAVLLIFQAMDAAGKDGVIKHVMSGVNPQGCSVYSFKAPSSEELDHDFLWRCLRVLPNRGTIGIFNRSYYEEVLVVRVHRDFLEREKLPPKLVTKEIWKERCEDIVNLESYLSRNGVLIRKFFLNVSKGEQKKRFIDRLEKPEKHWKFSAGDLKERERWPDYMKAYEEMIQRTATPEAPWYVVPADAKWFTRLVVSSAIIEALTSLDLKYPTLSKSALRDLQEARKKLL